MDTACAQPSLRRFRRERSRRIGELISDADLPVAHPDQVLARAIDVMIATEQARLPVVDRASGRLVGLLTRKHLLEVRAPVARSEQGRQRYLRRPARTGRAQAA